MTRTAALVLTNIVNALTDEKAIERNGNTLELIRDQLGYAGVKVTTLDLRNALDAAVDAVDGVCPSTFLAQQPVVSLDYGSFGMEFRLRPSAETYQAARACIMAAYAVTDTLSRTPSTVMIKGQAVEIETIRPRAFAIVKGHLRVRWAKGNFSVPPATTIRKWVGIQALET